jgi:hypothetical protein
MLLMFIFWRNKMESVPRTVHVPYTYRAHHLPAALWNKSKRTLFDSSECFLYKQVPVPQRKIGYFRKNLQEPSELPRDVSVFASGGH